MGTIVIALRVLICCVVFVYFVFGSLRSRYRYDRKKTALLVCSLVFTTMLTTIFFLTKDRFLSKYNLLGILFWIASAVLVFRLAIRGSCFELLFIVLVVLNLYVNIGVIAKVIVGMMDLGAVRDMAYSSLYVLVLALYVPLLNELLSKQYRMVIEFDIKTSFWKFIWIIPALIYVIYYIKFIDDYWLHPIHVEMEDLLFTVLWSFATYMFFWVTLQMLIQTYRGVSAAEQAKLIAAESRMQAEQYGRLLDNIEETARLRHDWRHHLTTINGFVEAGDMESLGGYMKRLIPEYASAEEGSVCENHVVDVILKHYAAIARASKIAMEIRTDIPRDTPVSAPDLCVVFGNLIENAMDACADMESRGRAIEVKAQTKEKQLIVIIKNTYEGTLLFREGSYCSTKHPGVGVGIPSVRRVVEKYGGSMRIDHESGWFTVCVLLYTAGRKNALISI